MSEAPLRLAVVGAGIMGGNHVRLSRNVRGAELAAVVDPDIARAEAVAAASGARACRAVSDIVGSVDLAVVAVPTPFHVETAVALAEAGIHVLVEKPLAARVSEAAAIVEAARSAGVKLAVGHVERFNGAVRELPRFLDRPIHLEATRVSPFTARVPDGVIFDLMIHDLDIVLSLVGSDTEVVAVSGISRAIKGATEDLATATVQFSNGITATFNTSRLGQQKIRTLEVTQEESVIVADLLRQDLTIHRMSRHEYLDTDGPRYRQTSVVEIPFIEARGEPLANELQHFVDAVRNDSDVAVSGAAAMRALDLAERIDSAVARS